VSGHVEDRLSAFLDGELAPAERGTVQAHLADCPACSAHLAELAALDAAARGAPVDAPEGYFETFPGRVRRRIENQKARSWSPPHWGWAVAAAAILAVVTPLSLREGTLPRPAAVVATPEIAPEKAAASEPLSAPADEAVGREKKDRRDEESPRQAPSRDRSGEAAKEKLELADRPAPPASPLPHDVAPAPAAPAGFATAPPTTASEMMTRTEGDAVGKGVPRERRAAGPVGEPEEARADLGLVAGAASGVRQAGLEEEAPPSPRTADEARRGREGWRHRARTASDPDLADAAWVRVVELGAASWRLGKDPRDLETLKQDAEAYLARADARRPDRVRAILAEAQE
jgi:hypothetical protein